MKAGPLLVVALLLGLIVGAVAYEVVLWHECQRDHSWFYCLRVLTR